MTNKRIRLPKEGLIEPEDVRLIDADVEAHGWANPAPPTDFSHRSPSQGGEAVPSDDDNDEPSPSCMSCMTRCRSCNTDC